MSINQSIKGYFKFSNQEKEQLEKVLQDIRYQPNGDDGYLSDLRRVFIKNAPVGLLSLLDKQRASITPFPYLLLENMPMDNGVFCHAVSGEDAYLKKNSHISENILLAIAQCVGEPYTIKHEGEEIVNNLIPSKTAKYEYTGIGSEVELDFHIENAALKFEKGGLSPMGLFLNGVHHDPNGPMTCVADIRKAVALLTDSALNYLREPNFTLDIPYRWRNSSVLSDVIQEKNVPILFGCDSYPDVAVAFYEGMITANTHDARKALDDLYTAVKEVSLSIDLKPGQCIYIDNRFALHSRTKFSPTFSTDGCAMRWIQRVFVAPNLWRFKSFSKNNSRIFTI